MTDWIYYPLLYLLGLALFFLELFIPSGGIIGIGALLSIIYALYGIYRIEPHGPIVAWICIVLTIVYAIVLVRWGIRRVRMDTDLEGGVATGQDVKAAKSLTGTIGETMSALRPAGVAVFNGRKFDVVTQGSFIKAGHPVEVVETSGNRIVVKEAHRETDASPDSS